LLVEVLAGKILAAAVAPVVFYILPHLQYQLDQTQSWWVPAAHQERDIQ
jgi:hypothetical protein